MNFRFIREEPMIVLMGVLMFFSIGGCCYLFFYTLPSLECKQSTKEVQQEARERLWADEAASQVQYFRDKRTGLCFAVYRHTDASALAVVPYEKVKHLLLNPIIEAEEEGDRKGHLSE